MIRALNASATGMNAQQLNIDNIANNLANVNTTAYKRSRIEFQDLVYHTLRNAGNTQDMNEILPTELQVGHGVRPVASQKAFEQGNLDATGNPLDIAIEADGFFQLAKPDGSLVYTRDGSFKISPEGDIVSSDGYQLEPSITIPQDSIEISIAKDGTLSVTLYGDVEPQTIGQLELVRFINPAGLKSLGQNLYGETVSSGPPIPGNPGEEGMGEVSQGYLESSNVQIVEEMVSMIKAQRAYEIASKAIRTADTMMETANQLKR